ncbi:nuclear transport factor 2 family protein [Skermanella sp. TT6]|uniref:Nuclear transport factor 2 family protein n=1 Tax=Skermanella cutis TaxID=2775420 RepID=A0ABX7BFG5_9PROT|nr:nuclear transport factor 2 family protein [Skermanella sp. TT6]QQP91816.1 nuclear transport factor 2 family protein [Skermanella sp. TT6]
MADQGEDDDDAIRTVLRDRAGAIRAKDAGGALAAFAADAVTFDLAPPLAKAGPDALDWSDLEDWFATWRGPIGYELADFSVAVDGDHACCHGFVRISGTKTDGEEVSVWARQTLFLRRFTPSWLIVHEHTSVPFHMDGSYRAAVDLKP